MSSTERKTKHQLMEEMFAQISGHHIVKQRQTFWIKGNKRKGTPDQKVIREVAVTMISDKVKPGTHHARKRKAWSLARMMFKQQRAGRRAAETL